MTRQKLMTPKEAAIHFSVTPRTITVWCRKGYLHAFKAGRVWRIRCNDRGNPRFRL